MAIVVVGGQARKVGKTSVMCGLIAAMPEMHWTAMKITGHPHGAEEMVAEEQDPENDTDTGRYLKAGAVRSFLVNAEQLKEVMPRIREEVAAAKNVMIESNSVMEFLRPDCYVVVVDEKVTDFKESAIRYLDRADIQVTAGGSAELAELVTRVRRQIATGR